MDKPNRKADFTAQWDNDVDEVEHFWVDEMICSTKHANVIEPEHEWTTTYLHVSEAYIPKYSWSRDADGVLEDFDVMMTRIIKRKYIDFITSKAFEEATGL